MHVTTLPGVRGFETPRPELSWCEQLARTSRRQWIEWPTLPVAIRFAPFVRRLRAPFRRLGEPGGIHNGPNGRVAARPVRATTAAPPIPSGVDHRVGLAVGARAVALDHIVVKRDIRSFAALAVPGVEPREQFAVLLDVHARVEVLDHVVGKQSRDIGSAVAEHIGRHQHPEAIGPAAARRAFTIQVISGEHGRRRGPLAEGGQAHGASANFIVSNCRVNVGNENENGVAVLLALFDDIVLDEIGCTPISTGIIGVHAVAGSADFIVEELNPSRPIGAQRVVAVEGRVMSHDTRSAVIEQANRVVIPLNVLDRVVVKVERPTARGIDSSKIDIPDGDVVYLKIIESAKRVICDDAVSSIQIGAAANDAAPQMGIVPIQREPSNRDIFGLDQNDIAGQTTTQ